MTERLKLTIDLCVKDRLKDQDGRRLTGKSTALSLSFREQSKEMNLIF